MQFILAVYDIVAYYNNAEIVQEINKKLVNKKLTKLDSNKITFEKVP